VSTPDPKRRGRPRSARADRAILDAALEEFADKGYEALSIERVAARAGVAKSTIYRRWPTKESLLVAAVKDLVRHIEPVDTGQVHDDLVAIMQLLRRQLFMGRAGTVVPYLAVEVYRGSALGRLDHERLLGWILQVLREAVQRGIDRGELRDDVDARVAAESLLGSLLLQHLTGRLRARGGSALPRTIVDQALTGLTARQG
jgi:AcrR family transcriptional regulator